MLRKIVYTLSLLALIAPTLRAQDEIPTARMLYDSARYDQALVVLTEFLENGANPDAYMLRGDCLQKLGDASMALNDYDKARVYGYREDDLFLHRGICKSTMGQMESARLDLISYIERQKEDPKGYYWMGALEYLSMENKACERYVDMAIALDSTYSDAYYLRGANLADQGKSLQAMEAFQTSMEMNPKQFRAKMNVAIMLIEMSQFRNAIEILSELRLENIDFHAEVLYYRGEAMYLMHDLEGACAEWSEAAALGDPDSAVNHKKLCTDGSGKPKFKRRSFGQF